jgi:hypothetical protein
MRWFKRAGQPAEMRVQRVTFLGDQDGTVERELKTQLLPLLESDSNVRKAYLVRVAYDDAIDHIAVALAIERDLGPDRQLVASVSTIFASMFRRDAHLDTIFITEKHKPGIEAVSRPFFTRVTE